MRADITPLTDLFGPGQLPLLSPSDRWLGGHVVHVINGDYLVRQLDGSWLRVKKDKTAACMVQHLYLGEQFLDGQRVMIMPDIVIDFLMGGKKQGTEAMVPIVSGELMVPSCDALAVRFEGKRYVNTWSDTLMRGDPAALNDPATKRDVETLLRMVREALCGRDSVEGFDAMMNMLNLQDPAEEAFRFTLSWLAAPFQEPGLNLPTNLWMLGPLQGIGRGTMVHVMQMLYGGSLVKTLNYNEFNKGWTDQMNGALLICGNEPSDSQGRSRAKADDMDLMEYNKRFCNEDQITINTRYLGTTTLPNFANFLWTGNNLTPMKGVDGSDRRSQFHKTSQSPAKKGYSQTIQSILAGSDPGRVEAMLQGFAFVLRSLAVEHDLIKLPTHTELRALNVLSSETREEFWLTHDESYEQDRQHPVKYWFERFKAFYPESKIEPHHMRNLMARLAETGHVVQEPRSRGVLPNGKQRRANFYMVTSERYPRECGPSGNVTAAEAKAKLAALRAKQPTAAPVLYLGHQEPA